MEKKIRTELLKMTGIMVVLAGLGIYAHEFVIAGIQAKVALNLSIFALFGMAAAIAFRHVFALRNEVVALKALQVDYGQIGRRPADPYARPAIVFSEPELLGQGYRLITEELGKQDSLQISNATVQTLLHDVDQRINDRKSSILYFSGLMVFLGLLGAFMGLMKTVHSVSDLIGAMDVSGKGGSDSFGKMIEGMKAPLNGMSVGFSSSLFGLMTSMVLGALERCMTSAMKSLRNEFEHWLSHLAALESTAEAGARGSHEFAALRKVLEAGTAQIAELRRAVGDAASQAAEARAEVERLAGAVAELADPRTFLQPVAAALHQLAQGQAAQLEDAARERKRIGEAVEAVQALVERTQLLDGDVLHRQLGQLIAASDRAAERAPVKVIKVTRGGGWLGTWLARRAMVQEARRVRAEAGASLAAMERLVAQSAASGAAEGVPAGVPGALEMLRLRLGLAVEDSEAATGAEAQRKRGQA